MGSAQTSYLAADRIAPRVLICEGGAVVGSELEASLRELGYAVVGVVSCAEQALQSAIGARPDLVLIDVHTRGSLDPVEAAKQIRDQTQIPVLLLTSDGDAATALRASSAEPLGFAVEPRTGSGLRSAIEIALQRHSSEKLLLERERTLALESERLATLIENLRSGLLLEDEDGRVRRANPQLTLLLDLESALDGLLVADALALMAAKFEHASAIERTLSVLWRGRTKQAAVLLRTLKGRTLELDYAPIGDATYAGALWTFSDVSERERAHEQHRADDQQRRELITNDELTGLLNRRGLLALGALQHELAARERQRLLIAYVDVDGMKRVNHTLGRAAGDELLRCAAQVLRNSVRTSDLVARLAGDEFAVLAIVSSSGAQSAIAERIARNVELSNQSRPDTPVLTMRIGWASSEARGDETIDALLAKGDAAMHEQKRAHRKVGLPP
jgi:diguanylate cyclase (GGDEF)-like protein